MRWPVERIGWARDWHHWNLGLVTVFWSHRAHSLYVMLFPGCWGVRIGFKRKDR